MTISTTTSRVDYTGNGVTTAFAVPFAFFGASELTVIQRVIATGAETTLALSTNYTVSGGNGSTGTVTAVVAPAATVQWTILRSTARTQLVDYVPNDPFPAETHERALDRLTAQVQEIERDTGRSLRVPASDPVPDALPNATTRAGKVLGFDASGNPIATDGTVLGGVVVSAYAATLLDDPDAATARGTLGATTVGDALFIAASQAAARNAIQAQPAGTYAIAGSIGGSGLFMNTSRLVGRSTASLGAMEEITVGAGLALNAGALAATTGIDRQVFNASATWTKPAGFPSTALVLLEAWGGGGSGRRDSGGITNASGGGGGGYAYRWLTLADLGPTETITIGAGGAARSGSNQNGAAGGNTTIGSLLDAFGGGGGGSFATPGGGGGMAGAGTTGSVGSVHSTVYGGGSGGFDNSGAVPATPSGWGGGGGGGGASGAAGGISRFGGAGGAAGATATGVAGTQPGGGGGGATGTSGAGADGRAIITVFR
jgi:hypothetical protein